MNVNVNFGKGTQYFNEIAVHFRNLTMKNKLFCIVYYNFCHRLPSNDYNFWKGLNMNQEVPTPENRYVSLYWFYLHNYLLSMSAKVIILFKNQEPGRAHISQKELA